MMVLFRGAETPTATALGLANLNPFRSTGGSSRCTLPLSPMAQLLSGVWGEQTIHSFAFILCFDGFELAC